MGLINEYSINTRELVGEETTLYNQFREGKASVS